MGTKPAVVFVGWAATALLIESVGFVLTGNSFVGKESALGQIIGRERIWTGQTLYFVLGTLVFIAGEVLIELVGGKGGLGMTSLPLRLLLPGPIDSLSSWWQSGIGS